MMKKNLSLLIAVSSLFLGFFLVPLARAGETSQETQLKARVTQFWTAWSKGEAEKVDLLVCEEDRQAFAKIPRFQLTEFRIDSVVIGADSKSAMVSTKIKRMFPMSTTPLDWILENQWVYEKGDWYLHYLQGQTSGTKEPGALGLFRRAATPPPSPPPTDVVFDSTGYDFGTVPASTLPHHVFTFENRGAQGLRLVRVSTPCQALRMDPRCVGLVAHSDGSFYAPGKKGQIEAHWQNALTPRKVDETIELYFSNGQSFNLRFVGTVTASKTPKP
jgi:hypothetical protein